MDKKFFVTYNFREEKTESTVFHKSNIRITREMRSVTSEKGDYACSTEYKVYVEDNRVFKVCGDAYAVIEGMEEDTTYVTIVRIGSPDYKDEAVYRETVNLEISPSGVITLQSHAFSLIQL